MSRPPTPNFLGLPDSAGRRSAGAVVAGAPSFFFDSLLRASTMVELYDEELGVEAYRKGITTVRLPRSKALKRAAEHAGRGSFVLFAGLNPAPALPFFLASAPVVVFSPRAGEETLADTVRPGPESLFVFGRRAGRPCADCGTGSVMDISARSIVTGGKVPGMKGRWPSHPLIIIDPLVLDPSLLPVPENRDPGGLRWYHMTYLLRHLCAAGPPAGALLLPCRLPSRDKGAAFILARLVAKLLAYALTERRPK